MTTGRINQVTTDQRVELLVNKLREVGSTNNNYTLFDDLDPSTLLLTQKGALCQVLRKSSF